MIPKKGKRQSMGKKIRVKIPLLRVQASASSDTLSERIFRKLQMKPIT